MHNIQKLGVMLDCSRNAVMKPEQVKAFILLLKKMGYNTLMLYTEDTYEVADEPYFGYLRGRYTKDELRDIDRFASANGFELIPCIQALAHFTAPVKQERFAEICDVNDILLAGDEKTYAFIERLFRAVSECFTSRNIHIGMDEAHMVGLGKYLDRNGYQNRMDILLKHLDRVNQIAVRYGFKPNMWSDMFFRLAQKGEYYSDNPVVDAAAASRLPKNVALTYWDYYHADKTAYDVMIQAHRKLGSDLWFAGGAWTWTGFAPLNAYSMHTMRPAMQSVRENGIENVFITMWGDNGKECSFYAVLPSLYAVAEYAKGNFDENAIKSGFEACFGMPFDAFMLLDKPNGATDGQTVANLCKCALYQDCFMGIFDSLIAQKEATPFAEYAGSLKQYASHRRFGYIFDAMSKLCGVMAIKYDLGVRTRKAYRAKDREALKSLAQNDYAALIKRLDIFYKAFYTLWHKENKPQGFEIQDARLGGLKQRIASCKNRLFAFASGKIDRIEELEETILSPNSSGAFLMNGHSANISTSIT